MDELKRKRDEAEPDTVECVKKLKQEIGQYRRRVAELETELADCMARETRLESRIEELSALREPVKQERATTSALSNEAELYSWDTVETNDTRCLAVYGFTAQQLDMMAQHIDGTVSQKPKKKGRKTSDWRVCLLVTLVHYRYYTTIPGVAKKFAIGSATVLAHIKRTLSDVLPVLWLWSQPPPSNERVYVQSTRFIQTQKPEDTTVAHAIYDKASGKCGMWLHCMHCATTGLVVAHVVSARATDDSVVASFHPISEEITEAVSQYNARLERKFALATARYRGDLNELGVVMSGLLTLANIDTNFGNPLIE